MKEELKNIVSVALKEIDASTKESELLNVKAKYLGKKSELSKFLASLKDMSVEDRKDFGSSLNKIKEELEIAVKNKLDKLTISSLNMFDETLPVDDTIGSLHPVTIVTNELVNILSRMGFGILTGPEMESEYYNFEALNIPDNHPARDMQDTYWLSNKEVLRTHTSPVQIRAMKKYGAPIRIAAPGRTFRNEDLDASHDDTFFQVEGMVIDKNITIGNLIYVLKNLLKEFFGKEIEVRLRPGYFPFVEPGFEFDLSCLICDGKGCSVCKNSGWIEFCGCGMIHPKVLIAGGIDPKEYNGFAFGFGLTRLVMMRYKIGDIRVLNSGDIRHLSQFNIE